MNPTEKQFIERWSEIINSVDKSTIPIDYVKRIQFNVDENTQKTIDIEKMKNQGLTPKTIETVCYDIMSNLGNSIDDVDFFVDIDAVAEIVQTQTDKLLK